MSEAKDAAQPMFERVALIGIGLIGSSISLAAQRTNLVGTFVGSARTPATLETAMRLGLIEQGYITAAEAVDGADLVILCTPVGVYGEIAKEIARSLKPGSVLTDVGSVKAAVVSDVAPHIPEGVHFVPAHPIAGTENSGPEAGFAELFDDRWCILTPAPDADKEAVEKVAAFWLALGAKIELMTPHQHDLALATTSHLPHLIAYNVVNAATRLERDKKHDIIKYSAGGFRDFTRIAASDPVMWRDIFLRNKDAVLDSLSRFNKSLAELERAVRNGDGEKLERLFSEAQSVRRRLVEPGEKRAADDAALAAEAETEKP